MLRYAVVQWFPYCQSELNVVSSGTITVKPAPFKTTMGLSCWRMSRGSTLPAKSPTDYENNSLTGRRRRLEHENGICNFSLAAVIKQLIVRWVIHDTGFALPTDV